MKTYKVKNYKGNLVESLSKFQKKHKGMKIVEACEDGDELKIKAEGQYDDAPPNPTLDGVAEALTDAFKDYASWFNDMILDPQNEDDFYSLLKALRNIAEELKCSPDVSKSSYPDIDAAIDDLEENYQEFQDYWKDK